MKKLLFLAFAGGLLFTSCTGTCDCDLIEDSYTWNAFEWELDGSTTVAMDTCLDAGVIDSTITGGNAFMKVRRVECP